MNTDFWKRVAFGAGAGLAGTVALQAIRMANQKLLPQMQPPIKGDPGEHMIKKTEQLLPASLQNHIPKSVETAAAKMLGMGYGMSFGAAYAASRPRVNRAVGEGALLGLLTWAVGFLGWLPRTQLMPPVWKHKPRQMVMPIAEHALFGLATVAGLGWLQRRALA